MDVWGVRYQVADVNRSVAFYTQQLGFTVEQQQGSAFAKVSGAVAERSRQFRRSPDARRSPEGAGGWNRLVLRVQDLPARVAALTQAGLRFRNTIETGPGGKQIQIEDPDGNPLELFEPAS
jgi:glyoxylase I family protein